MNKFREKLQPQHLLVALVFVMALVSSAWMVLLNNYAVHEINFTGDKIGILQSLREVPGFLAFGAIYVLLIIKEQKFAYLFLAIMALGVALTGWFPTTSGFYLTTVIMSLGMHYFETVGQSLTLQWIDKTKSPAFMGKQIAVRAGASLFSYACVWILMQACGVSYKLTYTFFGLTGLILIAIIAFIFPQFAAKHPQTKKFILRKRYWLYYGLTFLSGARRQIFMVFAAFLMVEQFNYSVGDISILFTINLVFNLLFAKKIGNWIGKVGEKKALTIEYMGLIIIFTGYAYVDNPHYAAALYVLDHMFFAMAIAIKTYLQKIIDPRDFAATASVSFTINHIAAVFLPALLGMVWLYSHSLVFIIGVSIACLSLLLSRFVPIAPAIGNETEFSLLN